jgi:nucleoside 2-deoxyribosyltransferase
MNPVEIDSLIAGGETKWVEFKTAVPPDHVIAKHIVAFANTEGGVILFGVSDKGTVVGIPEARLRSDIDRLKRVTQTLLGYPVDLRAIEHRGKSLINLSVDKAPDSLRPVMTAQGEIYTRHADRIHLNEIAQRLAAAPALPQSKATPNSRSIRIFVAMSFREEEEPALVDYYRAMRRACERVSTDVQLSRMDLIEGDYEISQKLMDEIDKADIVIADFTLNPRNVYFELGYCRGRKDIPVIQTARKDTTLEFDIRNWHTIFYKNATELEEKLVNALQAAVIEHSKEDNGTGGDTKPHAKPVRSKP